MASRYEKEGSEKRILSACVKLFIEKCYARTTSAEILKGADVTPGTFHNIYRTKSGVLTELTEFMFDNQFGIARKIVGEDADPVLMYCVETSVQLTLAELNENLRQIYVEAYTNQDVLDIINKKMSGVIGEIFGKYLPDCETSDFYEIEIGTSAFMRGFMSYPCDNNFTLEKKLYRFLDMSLSVFHVPENEARQAVEYIASLDIRKVANDVMQYLFSALEMKFDFRLGE